MIKYLKVCPSCRTYTMKDICPKCNAKTVSAHPPPFSPDDKYYLLRARKD